ncbi:MAG: hypothetical protein RRA32_03550 [bacterium]|nr:hypothetical protein [bacterium]
MDPVKLLVLMTGAFFLAFGVAAYRHFYSVLGGAAGLAVWAGLHHRVVSLPGLRDHPGTANLLLMILLFFSGMLLARKFRKVLAFVGGFGTGVMLSLAVGSFLGDGGPPPVFLSPETVGSMDLLAGMVGGVAFLFFEKFFAILLTSAVGGSLCYWAIGGRWTFPVCVSLGLAAQPLISMRFSPKGSGDGEERTRSGPTAVLLLLVALSFPSAAAAEWVVDRVNSLNSRVVIAAGWRDGVNLGEQYAVLGEGGRLIAVITISNVFSDSSYTDPIPADRLTLVRSGMLIRTMEEFDYDQAMKLGGEPHMEEFLTKYPASRFRKEVFDALDEVRFRRVEMIGSIDAFREFQRQYPTSRFGPEARRKEELLTLEQAREGGTEEAFLQFLQRFPGSSLLSGMAEVRGYLRAREMARIYAYEDFLAAYPRSRLADEFIPLIDEFELWAEKLEFGKDPVEAIRHFGLLGDETAVPLLVGKLTVPSLEAEARKAIFLIGEPALGTLMEVLISPLQSLELKDRAVLIIGELGDLSVIPAVRSYVDKEGTAAGRKALLKLEQKAGR